MAVGQELSSEELRSNVASLILELDAPKFETRELASRSLRELGTKIIPLLAESQKSDSLSAESAKRVDLILNELKTTVFKRLSKSFLVDRNPENDYDLPAWHAFREIAGSSRTSKVLFLDVIKKQPDLAMLIDKYFKSMLDEESGKTGPSPSVHVAELLSYTANKAQELRPKMIYLDRGRGIGEQVGLLFAAAVVDAEETLPVEVNLAIHSFSRVSFNSYLNKEGYRDCLRKLLSAWLPKTHEGMATDAMFLALSHDLEVVLPIAQKHLSQNFDVTTREYAFHCVAKFGDLNDLATLLPLIEEQTFVEEFNSRTGGIVEHNVAPPGAAPNDNEMAEEERLQQFVVRIRDLALASCMLLMDEDPRAVFPEYAESDFQGFFTRQLAVQVANIEERDKQIDAWLDDHGLQIKE